MHFAIPAQAMDRALEAFSAASGIQVFYETTLTAGRRSTEVRGLMDREAALRRLLQGSNLTARLIAVDTITIALASDEPDTALRQAKLSSIAYYGAMQADIMAALCRNALTRPGAYRAALQYWVDDSGSVARVRLLRSSDDDVRDDAIIRVLRATVFRPSPHMIPQPITFAVEPASSQGPVQCPQTGAEASRLP